MALFNSCLLLLINAGRGILHSNGASLMALGKADVHKGINALHHYENRYSLIAQVHHVLTCSNAMYSRWTCVGRFAQVTRFLTIKPSSLFVIRDTLVEVISVSRFHPPSNQPTSSLKRPRKPDEDNDTSLHRMMGELISDE